MCLTAGAHTHPVTNIRLELVFLPKIECGNSEIEAGETCDDGNTANLDGCSSTCQVETDYICVGAPSVCSSACVDDAVNIDQDCFDEN